MQPPAADVAEWLCRAVERQWTDPVAAVACCDAACGLATRLDDPSGLARALTRLGLCRAALARATPEAEAMAGAARQSLDQAIALFHSLQDASGEAEACNHLGNLYAACNEPGEALQLYHRSLALRRRQGDRGGEAGLLNNIGLLLRDTGQFADALACLFMSLEVAEAASDPHAQAHALASMGVVMADLDEPGRATEYHLRALALLVDWPDAPLEASTLTHLGRLLAETGHSDEALTHLGRALSLAHRSGQAGDLAAALLAQGLAHQQAGRTTRAEWLLMEALTAVRRTGNRLAEADALLALGRHRHRQGEVELGIELLGHALALAEPLRADRLCAQLHEALSQWLEQQGRFEPALRHFQAFHACRQRIQGQGVQRRLRGLLARADLERAQGATDDQRRRGDALAVALDAAREADRQKAALLDTLSAQAELLRQLAREDGLTGIANRRWLDTQLAAERERARRHGHPLTLAMVDVDHFKGINDRCSHRVGDEVLRQIARLLRDACRSGDIVGRYGGEEFLVVLVETPVSAAMGVCDKLRRLIAQQDWPALHPDLQRVTVSIGLAGDADDPVARDLLQDADRQLYRAKREGRNRCCA